MGKNSGMLYMPTSHLYNEEPLHRNNYKDSSSVLPFPMKVMGRKFI
jgi:hypothetical protein